jgi:hypothetical protein
MDDESSQDYFLASGEKGNQRRGMALLLRLAVVRLVLLCLVTSRTVIEGHPNRAVAVGNGN